jgi:hypothetical protein
VKEMHSRGMAHADIKPLKIVRIDTEWRLIDLDGAAKLGSEAGLWASSGHDRLESALAILKQRSSMSI